MNKRDIQLLERIFEDDIASALGERANVPTQIKGKRIEELERQGYVVRVEATLPGRFPVTVKGWGLTMRGHAAYCFSCDALPEEEA